MTATMGSGAMFDRIARRYDLINRINSLGLDRSWRRRAVDALYLEENHRLLDLATGTADLLIEVASAHPTVDLVGLDPSSGMLAIGERKLDAMGVAALLVPGSAEELPFEDETFDRVSMAFGIRNVADRPRALAEIERVLVRGGRCVILELSEPEGGVMPFLARLHVGHVVPRIGRLLSSGDEYRYLRDSIAAFPRPEVFAGLMKAAGLAPVSVERLCFGACALFAGAKP